MMQCKAEACVFRKIVKNEVSLVVGFHGDDIIVSGEQGVCMASYLSAQATFPGKKTEGTQDVHASFIPIVTRKGSTRYWNWSIVTCKELVHSDLQRQHPLLELL